MDQAILFFLYALSELCGEFIFTAIEAKSKAFLFFLLEFYGESIPLFILDGIYRIGPRGSERL